MQIPKEIIERIKDAADIVKEIEQDQTLRKQGVNYFGLCPYHGDKTPSLSVSVTRRMFKCFACGEHGDVIKWRMDRDGISFEDAVRFLGKKYNVDIPEQSYTPEQQEHFKRVEALRNVMREAQSMFASALTEDNDFLRQRNLSYEVATRYQLGYSVQGIGSLLAKKGYEAYNISEADIAKYDVSSKTFKDKFFGRVLFPYMDKRGQVIGWTGRDIRKDAKSCKYLNTGETPLFTKGNNIYGLYQAKKSIIKLDKVYVVEGQMDVLSLVQYGVENVVAGSGTAFTEAQMRLLLALTMNVTFIYDGDNAGVKAAEKNLLPMVQKGFHVRCVSLPVGQDPDDMAQSLKEHTADWLSKSETSYVKFLSSVMYNSSQNEFEKLASTKFIVNIIANESEEIIKSQYLQELTVLSKESLDALQNIEENVELPEKQSSIEDGFHGIEDAKAYIDKDYPILHLTNSFEIFFKKIHQKMPYVYYQGVPSYTQIQELTSVCENVLFDNYDFDCDSRKESIDCLCMKELWKHGAQIDVWTGVDESASFINYYISYYADLIEEEKSNVEITQKYMLRCAEMISYAKETVRTISMDSWAKKLGLKVSALKDIVKPYTNERKSKSKILRDDSLDDDIVLATDRIPEYVENSDEYSKMLKQFNYYPIINKDGKPVCYMFRTDNGSFKRVGDFYMEPLLHVYAKTKEENKRIIRLNSLITKQSTYVEWPSSTFSRLNTVAEMLFNEGSYNFINGTAADYEKIKACFSYQFTKCLELKTYGKQHEGFFCFANAIFHEVDGEWRLDMADELGIMEDSQQKYYSPAFSKINTDIRKDDDQYEQIRSFVYKEVADKDRITFKRWAELMAEVYKINNNGMWAIMYAILCAFRSEIQPMKRFFTALFFTGPTNSGKTQIAISCRSLFVNPEQPSTNLKNTSDAAFFSILEKFRDVPVVFEEYNDDIITDNQFQGLKSVTYDGDGKTKRKSASTNDVETSKVNSPVVLLGQHAPSKDDGALCNRVILLEVPVKNDRTKHETDIFNELKRYEKKGLAYLLIEILKLRPLVTKYYESILEDTVEELKTEMRKMNKVVDLRLINTNSIFLSMVKLMKMYAQHLELPFTVEDFKELCVKKVIEQSDILKQSDKLAMFFQRISTLIDKGIVIEGRDFKIVETKYNSVALKDGDADVVPGTRILYVNLSKIYEYYSNAGSLNGEKPMKLTDLRGNLHSHPSYLGTVSNTRFAWQEAKEVPVARVGVDDDATGKNMSVSREIIKRSDSSSAVVLNYEILEQMDIHWLRDYKPIEQPNLFNTDNYEQ